jgi:cytoskeleton protein RodZ
LPAGTWPSPHQETSPALPPAVVAVPAPPPPVVMSVPSIGQAQAAQPPEPVRSAAPDPQEAVARGTVASTPLPAPAAIATPAVTASPDVTAAPSLPVPADTQVHVRTNSWVELRAPNGDILAQTYVRAGESYTVPAGISYRIIDAR